MVTRSTAGSSKSRARRAAAKSTTSKSASAGPTRVSASGVRSVTNPTDTMKTRAGVTVPATATNRAVLGTPSAAAAAATSTAPKPKMNVPSTPAGPQSRVPKVTIPTVPAGPQSKNPSPTGPGAMQLSNGGQASMRSPGPVFANSLMPSLQSRLGSAKPQAPAPASAAPSAPAAVSAPAPTREEQIAAARKEAERLQGEVNKLAEQQKSKLDTAISSDEPVVSEEETALDLISYDSPTRDALDFLEKEIERQEGMFAADKRAINADFASQKTTTEKAQSGETGQLSAGLAAAGGYLGFSGSGTGVMLNLAKGHRDELLALEAERQNAIVNARNAAENRRFDLVREYAAEIARVDNEVYTRKQDYFTNKLRLQEMELSREAKMKLEGDIFAQIKAGKTTTTDIYEALGGAATVEEINDILTGFIPDSVKGEGGLKFSSTDTARLIGAGMSQADIITLNETLNEEGYTDAVKAALTPSQRYAVEKVLNGATSGTGTTSALGKPLSVLDLGRIEEMYDVRFPYGITQAEVTKFFEETAGMLPEEQQALIDESTGATTGSSTTFTKEYLQANLSTEQLKTLADKTGASRMLSGKEKDIARMFDSQEYMTKLNGMVAQARALNYSDEEIIEYLTN